MNRDAIKQWINIYKKDFATRWEKHHYKWEAVQSARSHWNIESSNLQRCFELSAIALNKNRRLLHPFGERMIYGMLQQFLTYETDSIREALRHLLSDNNRFSVEERIETYLLEAEEIRERGANGEHPEWRKHFQTKAGTSALLWLIYPETFYYVEPQWLANALRELGANYSGNRCRLYYAEALPFFDIVREELNKPEYGLRDMLQQFLSAQKHYEDENLSVLTNDFMEYVGRTVQSMKSKLNSL